MTDLLPAATIEKLISLSAQLSIHRQVDDHRHLRRVKGFR
jgi:hypothetical protein